MLYIFHVDLTLDRQTMSEFDDILRLIYVETNRMMIENIASGKEKNQLIVVNDYHPEWSGCKELMEKKLHKLHTVLYSDPLCRSTVVIHSLFYVPGVYYKKNMLKLLQLIRQDTSPFLMLYYGMHYISTLDELHEPIAYRYYELSTNLSTVMKLFITNENMKSYRHFIPSRLSLKLFSLDQNDYKECAGIGLVDNNSIDSIQKKMKLIPASQFIDYAQTLFDIQPKLYLQKLPQESKCYENTPDKETEDIVDASNILLDMNTSCDAQEDYEVSDTIIRIKLNDVEAVDQWAKQNDFQYVHDLKPEIQLALDKVAVLGNTKKLWGVYTEKPIKTGVVLGKYMGEYIRLKQVDNWDYIFKLTTFAKDELDEVIDARLVRNWTAFVNSSASFETANVEAILVDRSILYRSVRPINTGEQLLIYYGDDYVLSNMRYLHTKNGPLDSWELLQKYAPYYSQDTQLFPENFVRLFKIPKQQLFKVASFPSQVACKKRLRTGFFVESAQNNPEVDLDLNVDIPCLAMRDEQDTTTLLPQEEQENITTLMLAAWHGDLTLIHFLLNNGANPNIQSSISGICALHLVVDSEISFERKKAIINTFVNHNKEKCHLNLQDSNNQTILHWAIKKNSIELVTFLLNLEKKKINKKRSTDLMNCVDNQNKDPFLLSLFLGHDEIAHYLFSKIKTLDLESYLAEESIDLLIQALQEYKQKSDDMTMVQDFIDKMDKIADYDKAKQLIYQESDRTREAGGLTVFSRLKGCHC